MTDTREVNQQQLTSAFQRFNELSESLGESYSDLQVSVAHLTEQLAQERNIRLEQLVEKEALALRLSALVGALPGGVLVLDDSKVVMEANPQALQLFGQDILFKHWPMVMSTFVAEQPDASNPYRVALRDGRSVRICEESLDESGFVVLVTDLTEMHEWQESAHRDQRLSMLGEMTARLAHQLRTPLSSAMLYLSHLSVNGLSDQRRTQLLGRIDGRLKQIEEQIEGMLGFTRGASKQGRFFRIATLVEEFRLTLEPMIAKAGGTLSLRIDETASGVAWGCPEEINAALVAIAENAIGHVEQLQLTLALKVSDEWIDMTIEDNGHGVDAAIAHRIFDPFFTTRAKGTGLGLAMVDTIARQHGGRVELVAGNNGATFHVRLARYGLQELRQGEAV